MFTFVNWYYITQTRNLIGILTDLFGLVASIFAIRMMWQHITEPLYQDYTYAGRAIGFMIRSLRIILGLLVEGLVILVLLAVLALWVVLPILIIGKIIYILITLQV